jgi:superfamily II DNA/RNA helicase
VAARGIDVPTISHVINYGLPMKAEDYVHRIGRTGRAGRSGLAVTLAERRDASMIHSIQRFTTQRIPPAVIAGLEPRRPEPKPAQPARFAPGRGGPRRGGPAFGHAERRGQGNAPWAKARPAR